MQSTEANPNAAMYAAEEARQQKARSDLEHGEVIKADAIKKYYDALATMSPTPTQLENDLAALGVRLPDPPPEAPEHHPTGPAPRTSPATPPTTPPRPPTAA